MQCCRSSCSVVGEHRPIWNVYGISIYVMYIWNMHMEYIYIYAIYIWYMGYIYGMIIYEIDIYGIWHANANGLSGEKSVGRDPHHHWVGRRIDWPYRQLQSPWYRLPWWFPWTESTNRNHFSCSLSCAYFVFSVRLIMSYALSRWSSAGRQRKPDGRTLESMVAKQL